MALPAYCTSAQVRALIGEPSSKHDTKITDAITRASAILDNRTGTWFDARTKQVSIKPGSDGQERILMPAPIISLTSVTENGVALSNTTQYLAEGRQILRVNGYWETNLRLVSGSAAAYPIVVLGSFGYSAVPEHVKAIVAEMAAILAGLKTKTWTTGDGAIQAASVVQFPDYLNDEIASLVIHRWGAQRWLVADAVAP